MNIVYTMTFADGSEYIGATTRFAARRKHHLRALRRGTHSAPVQAAYARWGPPTFLAVASALAPDRLTDVEAAVMESRAPVLNTRPADSRHPLGPHSSYREMAKALGVSPKYIRASAKRFSYEAVLYRLAYLLSPPPKPVAPPKPPHPSMILVDGVLDFPKNHRARLGISEERYRRANNRGIDPFSIGPPVAAKPRMITAAGRTMALRAWSRESGVAHNTIASRIDYLNWTPEQAVGLEPGPMKLRTSGRKRPAPLGRAATLEHAGHTGTFTQLAKTFGVPYSRAYARFKSGMPLDQVFTS